MQVEGTVFAVFRKNIIDDSEFFRELLSMPPEKDQPVEGSCAEHPLRVEGVQKEDMRLLLRALYPRYVCTAARCTSVPAAELIV